MFGTARVVGYLFSGVLAVGAVQVAASAATGATANAPAAGVAANAGVGDDIRIDTRVAADSITVGERLHIRYRASYPDSLVLLPPEAFDTGTCRLVSLSWRNDKAEGKRLKKLAKELDPEIEVFSFN